MRRGDFNDVYLYGITMNRDDIDFYKMVEQALIGGCDAIQLREKTLAKRELIEKASKIKELCVKYNAYFIVNDHIDVAYAVKADGVHLGHTDTPLNIAREILGYDKIIGASSHSVEEALTNQKIADYISCSPIFPTPTKPEYKPVGLELIKKYIEAKINVPFFALGGIDESNIDLVLKAGAKRIAMVRGIFSSNDIISTTRRIKEKILSHLTDK